MVNDPLMGTFMDKSFSKSHGKKDKFRPWMLRSIPIIVIGLIAFFSVPSMFEGTIRLAAIFSIKNYLRIRLYHDEHCHGIRSWGNGRK